eukprot:COSAG05_NODE_38_length_27626_cov_78.614306_8_plen_102_part_00
MDDGECWTGTWGEEAQETSISTSTCGPWEQIGNNDGTLVCEDAPPEQEAIFPSYETADAETKVRGHIIGRARNNMYVNISHAWLYKWPINCTRTRKGGAKR